MQYIEFGKDKDKVKVMQVVTNMFSKMDSNDLGALKKYLDSGESKIHDYTKAIEYSYNVMPQLFRQDGDNVRQVNPDQSFSSLGLGASAGSNSLMSSMMSTNVFYKVFAEQSPCNIQHFSSIQIHVNGE